MIFATYEQSTDCRDVEPAAHCEVRSKVRRQARVQTRLAHGSRRRGAVLIVSLVLMAVVMTLLGVLLQGTLRARRQLHVERDRRQTELLLDAGLARATFRLNSEAEYSGETWRLEPQRIVGGGAGEVTIVATRDEARPQWKVQVVAEYPLGDERSVRRSRTVLIPMSQGIPASKQETLE